MAIMAKCKLLGKTFTPKKLHRYLYTLHWRSRRKAYDRVPRVMELSIQEPGFSDAISRFGHLTPIPVTLPKHF